MKYGFLNITVTLFLTLLSSLWVEPIELLKCLEITMSIVSNIDFDITTQININQLE